MRARQLGITLGLGMPGELNAITDVPGVRVGHSTIKACVDGKQVRTGVTLVQPRAGEARQQPCFAGYHVLNGNGDATGLEWISEAGLLTTPMAITNTHSIGVVRDSLIALERERLADPAVYWCMPVVMETYDGLLNDIWGQHVRPEHVRQALDQASGPVQEGAVGGGTGMICHEFKGGIGTASRRLPAEQGGWTVGVLVQANHGKRQELRVDGYPVGRHLMGIASPFAERGTPGMGSIVVIIATDAPCCPTNASAWRSARPSASRVPAAAPKIPAATCSWRLPPVTVICHRPTMGARTCPSAPGCRWSTTTIFRRCSARRQRWWRRRSSTPFWQVKT